MSDDIPVDGRPVRADLVSGSYYQVVKLDLGGDGISDPVVNRIPIRVDEDDSHGTVGGLVPTDGVQIAGSDGTNLHAVKVDNTGIVQVAQNGTLTVSSDGISSFKIINDDLNSEVTLLASQAYSSTQTSPDQINYRWSGARFFLNVSAAPTSTSETLTVSIQAKDALSGNYFTVSKYATLPAADSGSFGSLPTLLAFEFYPGAVDPTITNFKSQSSVLPYRWRAVVTHSAASSWTYSLSACLLR